MIWALRKELATKTKQLADFKQMSENQTDEITTLKNATLVREASQSETQHKLHAIYEEKLEDAVEEERARMHEEYTKQLDEQT